MCSQKHEIREAAIAEQQRVISAMTARTDSALERLIGKFVAHHSLQETLLGGALQHLGEKAFTRPTAVSDQLND
jgi:hypothetical protein